jgi:hypothetical protein
MIHHRKCWACGNIAEHTDNVVPAVLCKKCGSQDTRPLRNFRDEKPEVLKNDGLQNLALLLNEQIQKLRSLQRVDVGCWGDGGIDVNERGNGEYVHYLDLDSVIQEMEERAK